MKTGYYLELLMAETMKLIGSNKSKITKNDENVPDLEITEVVLVIVILSTITISKIQEYIFVYICSK